MIRRDLGDEGRAWVQHSLAGGLELSRAASSVLDLKAGHVYGYYPPTPADVDVTRFGGSLFSPRGPFSDASAGDSEDAVFQAVRDIGGDFLILETAVSIADFIAHLEDRADKRRLLRLPHVMYWQPLHEGSFDEMSNFLAQSGYDNAFSVAGPDAQSFVEGHDVSYERVARATRAVLVPAYDSETFLLWTPASRLSG